MASKRGEMDWSYVIWTIFLLVLLFVVGMLYLVLKGEGAGLLDRFFNWF